MRHFRWTTLIAGLTLATAGCAKGGNPHSTLSGVYTKEQATRGKTIYGSMCISCHAGMGNHTGPLFRNRWGGYGLQELFGYISDNMPKNDPGSLKPEEYVAVIAYLLEMNGMPAGNAPLPVDTATLRAIIYDTVTTKQ